jgi:hypothetical protein
MHTQLATEEGNIVQSLQSLMQGIASCAILRDWCELEELIGKLSNL